MQYYDGQNNSVVQYVAQQEGFFKKNNLDVSMVNIASAPAAMSALAGGSVDMLAASPESILPAIEKGVSMKVVSGATSMIWQLVVRGTNNPTTYPASILALKGKTIGVTALGSSGQDLVEGLLESVGLPKTSVTFVGTGAPSTAVPALLNGEVQATLSYQPITYLDTKSGQAQVVLDLRDGKGLPPQLHGGDDIALWGSSSFVSQHPQVVKEVQRAMAQAALWIQDPKNESALERDVNSEDGNTISASALKSVTADVRAQASAQFSVDSLSGWVKFATQYGLMPKPLTASDLFAPGVPGTSADVKSVAGS
jgi:NitT/TauT family transport system substrate-binding protein